MPACGTQRGFERDEINWVVNDNHRIERTGVTATIRPDVSVVADVEGGTLLLKVINNCSLHLARWRELRRSLETDSERKRE